MKMLINEGRYDSLVSKLSNRLLDIIKKSYSSVSNPRGVFSGQKIYFKQGESIPDIDDDSFRHIYFQEVENTQIPLDFNLTLKVQWIQGLDDFRVGGDAYNETKRTSADLPLIEIRFELDPADYPNILSGIAMELRDTLRHEIEHTTQSGWNTIDSKYLPSDMRQRNKIQSGERRPAEYFLLKKEIPAMIQGMYLKAKKKREPFKMVVDEYLGRWVANGTITDQEKQRIIDTWRTYLPKLGIRQEL
jgi:hypothetical protein